jgi:hypothetical protein
MIKKVDRGRTTNGRKRGAALGLAAAIGTFLLSACRTSECARADYSLPECRVIAENEFARARVRSGALIQFEHPLAVTSQPDVAWEARGVIGEQVDGRTAIRVATLGDFAISLRNDGQAPIVEHITLTNIDDRSGVNLEQAGKNVEVAATFRTLVREVDVALAPGESAWIRGRMPCPSRYRLVALGDIQTNPLQFERILNRIREERIAADLAGEPLLGFIILGDLSETSAEPELRTILNILDRSPVPVATIPGNHDVYSVDTPYYNRIFGPGNYTFQICETKVALLDSGNGGLAESVLLRLPDLLKREGARDLIAGVHHPPFAGVTGSGWTHEDHAEMLLSELVIERADLLLTGHVHALIDAPQVSIGREHVRQVIAGTGGATQGFGVPVFGYVRLTFGGESTQVCFAEVPPPGAMVGQGTISTSMDRCGSLE